MKVIMIIHTQPDSGDLEDEIGNLYQDRGLRSQLEEIIEEEIRTVMGWQEIRVSVELNF